MTQWEYLVIEVWKGRVDTVNGELVNKETPKRFSNKDMYTLTEYLPKIGQEGWEIISVGSKNLLLETNHNSDVEVLLAKRPKPEA